MGASHFLRGPSSYAALPRLFPCSTPTHPPLFLPWQVGVGVNYSPRQTSLSVQRATDRRDSAEERFFRRLEAEVRK